MKRTLALVAILSFTGCAELRDFLKSRAGETADDTPPTLADYCGDQDEAACARALLASPPEEVARDGFRPIVVDAQHIFLIPESQLTEREDALHAEGELYLASEGGFLKLADAALDFANTEAGRALSGTSSIPLPTFGLFERLELQGEARGQAQLVTASALADHQLPLDEGRRYLRYELGSELRLLAAMSEGDARDFGVAGPGALVVVDPTDPALFVRGGLSGVEQLGPLEDGAVGYSAKARIPFAPKIDVAASPVALPFDGALYLRGKLELPGVPLEVDGESVARLDGPLGAESVAALGSNGRASLVHSVLGVELLRVDLADATVVLAWTEDGPSAAYAGRPVKTEIASLPIAAELKTMAGTVSEKARDTFEATGDFVIGGEMIDKVLPFDLPDLKLKDAVMRVAEDGRVHLGGPLDGELTVAGVKLAGGAGVQSSFLPDGSEFELRLRGKLGIGPLAVDKTVVINQNGLTLE